jgi:hypothetical protein
MTIQDYFKFKEGDLLSWFCLRVKHEDIARQISRMLGR